MRLDRFSILADEVDAADPQAGVATRRRGAILTVHGMNTIGVWQEDLSSLIQDAGFNYHAIRYEKIRFTAALPGAVDDVMDRIEKRYNEQRARELDVSAIAHSLGSLALGTLIWRRPSTCFHRIVLYGSILSRRFPWHECAKVTDVLHEVGGRDIWPWFAPIVFRIHSQVGLAGVKGFIDPPSFVKQLCYPGSRHSDLQSEAHFKKTWIPFIAHGPDAIYEQIVTRRCPSAA